MEIITTTIINSCYDCKYLNHTGAFTKGGAKPCCNHRQTCKEKGYDCFKRIIPYESVNNKYFLNSIHSPKQIPKWCPLKRGYEY